MSDLRIDGVGPVRYTPLGQPLAAPTTETSFQESLKSAVREVNDLQLHAGEQARSLVAGEPIDVHEVMISAEEAGIAFDLMMEIRNKLLEAYQDLQRMQI